MKDWQMACSSLTFCGAAKVAVGRVDDAAENSICVCVEELLLQLGPGERFTINWGSCFGGPLHNESPLLGTMIGPPDFWKLPFTPLVKLWKPGCLSSGFQSKGLACDVNALAASRSSRLVMLA